MNCKAGTKVISTGFYYGYSDNRQPASIKAETTGIAVPSVYNIHANYMQHWLSGKISAYP